MSAYISLYRKWRPRVFSDVIGQDHVTTTLKNAITAGRVSHAFLFTGPRGTGKTTVAKILANSLNCKKGVGGEPCNECDVCASALNGSNPDVLEIDAASNRGIDEIREIKERAYFSPVSGDYKVYIVDEVHMLTTEAFNALLKILEEPPAHVIFVLATTDIHKVPPTIISRCQRFDFKRITISDIVSRLSRVAKEENIAINEGALSMIASHVRGSLRDALGLLEQLTAFAAADISEPDVVKLLDATDIGALFEMTDLIRDKNTAEAVFMAEKIARAGRDLQQFIRDWQTHLRDLFLILNVTRDTAEKLINTTPEVFGQLHGQSQSFTSYEILHYIELLSAAARDIKSGTQPRLSTELAILKMTREQTDLSLDGVLFRLKVLEDRMNKIESGGVAGTSVGGAGASSAPAGSVSSINSAGSAGAAGTTRSSRSADPSRSASAAAPSKAEGSERSAGSASSAGKADKDLAASNPEAKSVSAGVAKSASQSGGSLDQAPVVTGTNVSRNDPTPEVQSTRVLDIEAVKKMWPVVMDRLRTKKIHLYALLLEARPSTVENGAIILKLSPTAKFHKKEIEREPNKLVIEQAILDMTGADLKIICEADEKPDEVIAEPPTKSLGLTNDEKDNMDSGDILDMLKNDLGAELVEEINIKDKES